MSKKKEKMELRYYELPQNESALALLGETWIREYGLDEKGNRIQNCHFHNLMEIGICKEGRGELIFDEKVIPYQENSATILPKNYPHNTNNELGEKSYWEYLYIDPDKFLGEFYTDNQYIRSKLVGLINKQAMYIAKTEGKQIIQLIQMIMDEFREKKEYYRESVKGLTLTLLMEIVRHNSSLEEQVSMKSGQGINQIQEALDYINVSYMEPIKIETLSQRCHMSETHFRRLFREYIHMTPLDYINLIRIQMACEIMKKTNDSMDDVAKKVGFETTSSFNRNFKEMIGMTPYHWKKNPENYESKILNCRISALKGW